MMAYLHDIPVPMVTLVSRSEDEREAGVREEDHAQSKAVCLSKPGQSSALMATKTDRSYALIAAARYVIASVKRKT